MRSDDLTCEGSCPAAAMSIDVEEWFQVENLRRAIPPERWNAQPSRVERAMDRMLEHMDAHGVRATCFVLGWVAERHPELVRRLVDAGHEIASHGYDHQLLHTLDVPSFRRDVERSKKLLEAIVDRPVRGYRAPSFSLTSWAPPILRHLGFEYDSSVFPTTLRHDRYGKIPLVRSEEGLLSAGDGLVEVGVSCLPLGRHALPWAGGGYFRLLPYRAFRAGVRRILRAGNPYVFYIHPWEIDPDQPRIHGLRRSERLRHYLNLERAESRWSALLRDFDWVPIEELIRLEKGRPRAVAFMCGRTS
jgi:polysaccharide deacetylase family protein (PEP-CTERM system associated)